MNEERKELKVGVRVCVFKALGIDWYATGVVKSINTEDKTADIDAVRNDDPNAKHIMLTDIDWECLYVIAEGKFFQGELVCYEFLKDLRDEDDIQYAYYCPDRDENLFPFELDNFCDEDEDTFTPEHIEPFNKRPIQKLELNLTEEAELLDTFKLTKEKFPIAYQKKMEELVEQGLTEQEAEDCLKEMEFELEVYYHKTYGLFAVESGAVESGNIYSPYNAQKYTNPQF